MSALKSWNPNSQIGNPLGKTCFPVGAPAFMEIAGAGGNFPPPRKKRKREIQETLLEYYPDISIRLTADDTAKLGLQDANFLAVDRLEYVTWNAEKSSYLYSICSLIFEEAIHQFTLLRSPVGKCPSEASDIWRVVEGDDRIEKGNYLLQFEESASKSHL